MYTIIGIPHCNKCEQLKNLCIKNNIAFDFKILTELSESKQNKYKTQTATMNITRIINTNYIY